MWAITLTGVDMTIKLGLHCFQFKMGFYQANSDDANIEAK